MPEEANRPKSRLKSWKGVRENFRDFLGAPRGALASLEGPGKEQVAESARERLLENVISSINKDTPEGRHMYQRWTRAQEAHHQVVAALRGFPKEYRDATEGPGRQSTREAVKVSFPEKWCHLLSEDEIIAELVVDCATSNIVDSLLDAAIELLEVHEGWHLPCTHKAFRRLQSTPELRALDVSPMASWANLSGTQSPKSLREQVSQPDLPPRWRQQVDRSRGSRDVSVLTSRELDPPVKGQTLKYFRSSKPFDPFMARLYAFTDSQRPQRRLQRAPRDPFAPKWSFPEMAHHFPEQWNRLVPPSKLSPPVTPRPTNSFEEEEAPPGYTWLQRKTRDGQTVFPYSLASHRAFFQSYQDPALRAKAEAVVPLRMTEWPRLADSLS